MRLRFLNIGFITYYVESVSKILRAPNILLLSDWKIYRSHFGSFLEWTKIAWLKKKHHADVVVTRHNFGDGISPLAHWEHAPMACGGSNLLVEVR